MSLTNDNLDPKQLKWAYWYVTHKMQLRALLAGLLIVTSVLLYGFSIYRMVIYFSEMIEVDNMIVEASRDKIDFQYFRQKNAPQPIAIRQVKFFSGRARKDGTDLIYYDLMAIADNVNPRWRAEFDYRFVSANWQGETKQGFILPNEKKYLLDLGILDLSQVSSLKLEISNIKWRRISLHDVKDVEKFKDEHFNLLISDKEFKPSIDLVGAEGRAVTRNKVSFKVRNFSAYGYWQFPLNITLDYGDQVVGVNRFIIENFASGDEEAVEVVWSEKLPPIQNFIIEPDVNIFDESVFMVDGRL